MKNRSQRAFGLIMLVTVMICTTYSISKAPLLNCKVEQVLFVTYLNKIYSNRIPEPTECNKEIQQFNWNLLSNTLNTLQYIPNF